MKKYILMILIFSCISYSQDIRNPKPVINSLDNIFVKNSSRYIKAWNWLSIDRNLDEAMKMDFFHRNNDQGQTIGQLPHMFPENQWRLQAFTPIGHLDKDYSMLQAPAIEYSPAITLYTNSNFNVKDFQPLVDDVNGYVFGFRNIDINNGFISTSGTYKNSYNLLKNSGFTSRVLVLDNPWPDNELIRLIDSTVIFKDSLNCKEMFLTINLRSRETINTLNENDPVLTIKVPYWKNNDNTKYYIKFAQEPTDGLASTDTLTIFSRRNVSDRRGFSRKLRNKTSNYEEIAITGKMLKVNNAGLADSNITISAFFDLKNQYPFFNPILQDGEYHDDKAAGRISNMGIEVYYHGKIDVSLNYLRFETPYARKILRGERDTMFSDTLNGNINLLRNQRTGLNIHRFYGIDEFWVQNWLSHRYFNQLVDNMGCSEIDHVVYENLFQHCVNFPEFWTGQTLMHTDKVSSPFLRRGVNENEYDIQFKSVLGFRYGFNGHYYGNLMPDANHLKDTINSLYETFLAYHQHGIGTVYKNIPTNKFDYSIFDYVGWDDNHNFYEPSGTLFNLEYQLYKKYYNKSFLFSANDWWANIWAHNEFWVLEDNLNYIYQNTSEHNFIRAKTGEEFNLTININKILGTKGFVYWTGESQNNMIINGLNKTAINMATYNRTRDGNITLTGFDLINSNLIGSDYLNNFNDESLYSNINDNTNFNLLGISKERIYVGRASTRLEATKNNFFIHYNNDELKDLKLVAWQAKGFTQFYCQDPGVSTIGIINNFIDTTNIRTRKLWNPITNSNQITLENKDSSFYDITLLKSKSNQDMTSQFYIAYLNRRTDPLIYTIDTLTVNYYDEEGGKTYYRTVIDSSLKFYSTAEFDDYCKNGGYTITPDDEYDQWGGYYHYEPIYRDANYWRNMYWKKIGCRELRIKLALSDDPSGSGEYLKVEELGLNTPYFQDTIVHYWTKPLYYTKIDTVLHLNGTLIDRLLPGFGKIIHFEKKNIFDGECGDLSCENMLNNFEFYYIQNNPSGSNCCYDLYLLNNSNCTYSDYVFNFDVTSTCDPQVEYTFLPTNNSKVVGPYVPGKINLNIPIIPVDPAKNGLKVATFCATRNCSFSFDVKFGKVIKGTEIFCENNFNIAGYCGEPDYSLRNSTCCNSLTLYSSSSFDTKNQKNDHIISTMQDDSTSGDISKILVFRKSNGKLISKTEKKQNEKKINLSSELEIAKTKMDKTNGKTKV
jgi:hypothetical protein